MAKLSILQITPFFSPNVGGVETHLDDLMHFLLKQHIKNTVITYQALVGSQRGQVYEKRDGLEIHRIPWLRGIFYKTEKHPLIHFLYLTPYLLLKSLLLMRKIGRDIDIIHAHGVNGLVIGAAVKKLFHKRLVVSFHVEFNLLKNSLSTEFILSSLKSADYILVLTERSRQELIKMGIDQGKIRVYSYWVNQQVFKPRENQTLRKNLGWDERFTVLFVGRLAESKGVLNLLEAAKKMPEVRFVLIGSGQLDTQVKAASQERKNIVYLGRVANGKLFKYYNSADLLIVPSLVKYPKPNFEEGIPRVIIEALSCGLPVVGADNGGVKEVIEDGQVGIVTDGTVEDLVSAVRTLYSGDKLSKFKKRARQYALERFGLDRARIIAKTYEDLSRQEKIGSTLKKLLNRTGDMALKRRAQSVVAALDPARDKEILDAGCGDGFYLHLLSNLGLFLELTGTDFDKRGLESAGKNLGQKKIPLVQADLMKKLPFEENSFDGVVLSEVAEHLPDDLKGLKEIYRVLKPGGVIALTVPCSSYPLLWDPVNWVLEHSFKTHLRSGFWAGIWNQHLRLYTLEKIKSVLTKAGFQVEKADMQTFWCLPFSHNILNLGARMLVSGNLSSSLQSSASKFSELKNKDFNVIDIFFAVVNFIDKLNEVLPVRSSGVSIFVKARK